MQQSLAPEPAPQGHAGTDTGPHGLSSIQADAVQAIIEHCLEGRDLIKERADRGEFDRRYIVGYLDETLNQILHECKRLT